MAETRGSLQSSLAELISEHGIDASRGERIAARLIVQYPLARRIGVDALASRLEEWGLDGEAAPQAAFELLAFELLGRLSYDRVLAMVAARSDPALALGVCLRAASVRRTVRRDALPDEPGRFRSRLLRYALQWLR